jgi:hypothetical protein
MQLVEKLKHGAVARCRERVLNAAEKTKYQDKTKYPTREKIEHTSVYGFTAHLKERRGL